MNQLIRYETACRALADCKAVDEVKAWSDKAAAMQAYGRIAKDKTLEVDAAEIRLRAERRLGELLIEQKSGDGLNTGARGIGKSALVTNEGTPRLADAGISYDLSSRAQKLAAVPEDEFEREVDGWRERVSEEGARVTARLEAAGEKGAKRKPTTDAGLSDADHIDEMSQEIAILLSELDAASKDNAAMGEAFDADDRLAVLHRQNKELREANRVLQSRLDGEINKNAELVREVTKAQRKIERMERASVNIP